MEVMSMFHPQNIIILHYHIFKVDIVALKCLGDINKCITKMGVELQ